MADLLVGKMICAQYCRMPTGGLGKEVVVPRRMPSPLESMQRMVEEFESRGASLHHDSLNITLPARFFRFEALSMLSLVDPAEHKVVFSFRHRDQELRHELKLADNSRCESLSLRGAACEDEMDRFEIFGQIELCPSDARLFVLFLLGLFRGDSLRIRDQDDV